MKKSHEKLKRFIDVILSLMALGFSLPFWGIIGILIKLDSKGPVFFTQWRLGKNGRKFLMYKFRTMYHGVPFLKNPDGSAVVSENDPRVTKIGKILRKYSLDELPQLLNVILGDMSLVGPRPELPEHYKLYSEWEKKRLNVLPGMTGLAQVNGRNALSWSERKKFDVIYVENENLRLYFNILFKTFKQVIKGVGVFR